MTKKLILMSCILSFLCSGAAYPQKNLINPAKSCTVEAKTDDGTFANPVLYVDVPDPDVIRVGDNFYMVSTTMHFSPGCPIMKSTDLVNWQVAGYAHDQLEETDNFALKNGQNDYARGSWAANLRYDPYEKLFYLIVTCNTTQKSYIFTTPDIEAGRWHRNEVDMCYDPGLLFDDNGSECRKYIVHPDYDLGRHACYIREIISDGKGNVSLGKRERLIDYTQIENPSQGLRAEGYHGYHIGDYYYIFMIQGQGWQRQKTVWRSKSLEPQNQYGFVGVKKENGKFWLVMQRARQKDDAQGAEMERIALDGDKVYLRAECDFRNQADKAYFYYSLDGHHWNPIGDSLQMRFDWPDFVGQRFGLFNYATENTGGHADFDYFRVSDQLRHK